jgi:hypothetical protein
MDLKMSNYYHLPIYKEAYGLLMYIFKAVKEFDREYKHTVGERLKNECLDIMKNIYQASRAEKEHKLKCISDILDSVVHIKILLRVVKDLGVISLKRHVVLIEKVESLSKQATGWYSARVT